MFYCIWEAFIEAWPSTSGIKLALRRKERRITPSTNKYSIFIKIVILTGKGSFCCFMNDNSFLFMSQFIVIHTFYNFISSDCKPSIVLRYIALCGMIFCAKGNDLSYFFNVESTWVLLAHIIMTSLNYYHFLTLLLRLPEISYVVIDSTVVKNSLAFSGLDTDRATKFRRKLRSCVFFYN